VRFAAAGDLVLQRALERPEETLGHSRDAGTARLVLEMADC
jgi:hypothetical protein